MSDIINKRLCIISFTENGKQLSKKLWELLKTEMEVGIYTKCRTCINDNTCPPASFVECSVGDWTGRQMREKNALLFIGACGIAVRAAAPFLVDKLHDVPVLVMDEKGRYVIPILSGHMGGANALARCIAEKTGAEAVITTATDINQKFAVDLFAKRNNLYLTEKGGIAKVSAKVLAGEEITMSVETGHEVIGSAAGVRIVPYPPDGFVDVVVTSRDSIFDASVILRPREYVAGFGCRKGKSVEEIDAFIAKKTGELGISVIQISALASISQKREEQGILQWCRRVGIPFFTYTAEELQEAVGDFAESSFVRNQVGVGNVCERAAVRACGGECRLILPKTAENGMTIAIAKRNWRVCFDGE